jgi:phosphopantothenoylcysteine decarboxylase/phosphopantothenate--cysteine ligase
MAAAVADFRPAEAHATKLKRQSQGLSLELLPNDDILAEFGQARQKKLPVLIGFALETSDEERTIEAARGKLDAKRVDMVVANHADESIGRDDIRALLVSPAGTTKLDSMPKEDAADRILSFVVERLREQGR